MKIRATIAHTPSPNRCDVLPNTVIDVDDDGWITGVAPDGDVEGEVDVDLGPDHLVIPGLIDTHVHAPQFPQLGVGLDLPLEQWLFDYTFPLEATFADPDFAQSVWDVLVPTLLSHGTTTAVYYGSIHEEATTRLARTCLQAGQRAWVGRVAMDHPEGTPDWYRDADADASLAATRRSIADITDLDPGGDLVRPIITPRFIPACTDALLAGLGAMAAETGTLVQTHCSESDWEHRHVLERHGMTDTESLARFGLLRAGTVLAHAGHLTASDIEAVVGASAGVAHCPHSNTYFGNAVFPARRAIEGGMAVGLGTDIAGGPSPSLFDQITHSVAVGRMLDDGVDAGLPPTERGVDGSRIDIVAALWMATLGGASVLGEPLGLFEVGRRFDAVAIQHPHPLMARGGLGGDDPMMLVERVLRLAGREHVAGVWVNGTRRV